MTHDIMHCNIERCRRKELCRRYQAHLEAVEKGMLRISYYPPKDFDTDTCECFLYINN